MTALVSSTYAVAPPEVDGRCWVKEVHTTDDAQEFDYSYLCDMTVTDPQLVLEARAVIIVATLAKRAAALALVQGTTVPMTRFEFLSQFEPQERIAIRTEAGTDPVIYDWMDLLQQSGNVTRANAAAGLAYLVEQGTLSQARADAILGAFD
jgi:hypothetical protein